MDGRVHQRILRLLNLLGHTITLQPQQGALLDAILASSLLSAVALGPAPDAWRAAPKLHAAQGGLDL